MAQMPFFPLPLELRMMVYEFALARPKPITVRLGEQDGSNSASNNEQHNTLSLLHTSRQVRKESMDSFVKCNSFRILLDNDLMRLPTATLVRRLRVWLRSLGNSVRELKTVEVDVRVVKPAFRTFEAIELLKEINASFERTVEVVVVLHFCYMSLSLPREENDLVVSFGGSDVRQMKTSLFRQAQECENDIRAAGRDLRRVHSTIKFLDLSRCRQAVEAVINALDADSNW